ncbi:MAG: hypothetical protein NTU53_22930 [Planctomycetota bacterium]|nr:hypothetical protein [Planctomycetota bacterium]
MSERNNGAEKNGVGGRNRQGAKLRLLLFVVCYLLLVGGAGCGGKRTGEEAEGPRRLQGVSFNDPVRAVASNAAIAVRGARNETIAVAIQINQFPQVVGRKLYGLRMSELKTADGPAIGVGGFLAYQLLPMAVDINRASFVRQTGLEPTVSALPRALLPLGMEGGVIPLKSLRNANRGIDRESRADEAEAPAPIVWIDVQIPPTAKAGEYQGVCELVEAGNVKASVGVKLVVDDFVIPDERHLLMVGLLDWASLVRLYPEQFWAVQANLLSRREAKYAGAVKTLDDMVKLAQTHRTQLVIPRLQPIVKWPSGKGPQIDWGDFDGLVGPWLRGDTFGDLVPLGYWPLPVPDHMGMLDERSRGEYWAAAAGHFDQMDWLGRSAIAVEKKSEGRVRLMEAMEVSEEAAKVLGVHPRLKVSVPLEEEQVLLATPGSPKRIAADSLDRLLYAAPGLVSATPMQRLPENVGTRWLRTDLPGLIPYGGAGADEREVRLWAWLAFLRKAGLIQWPSVLPATNNAAEAGNPEDLVWFYPGSWFGVKVPVPTLQLKWLRRAQQDYEYLWLAKQRGQLARATILARLISKPVEIPPTQVVDAVHGLMSGSSERRTWADAMDLLTRTILLSEPGQAVDAMAERELMYKLAGWTKMHERPLLVGRSTEWRVDEQGGRVVDLRLGVDVYNAAEQQPEKNRLHWAAVPEGWQGNVPPVEVPQLGTYSVNRFYLNTRVDLGKRSGGAQGPVRVTFTDGFTGRSYSGTMLVPLGVCEQRQAAPPKLDGSLEDWSPEDALHEGALVRMLSRPSLQRQEVEYAGAATTLYSTWTAASLYVGFRIDGADSPMTNAGTNFIKYQLRRAWAEDVCEVLIQPVYADNSVGPLLHLACKPRGQLVISRRLDPRLNASPWQAFAASDVLYGYSMSKAVWRGEIGIPWDVINDSQHAEKRPVMLRMNFSQHLGMPGESASWAGPVDFGRDEGFMGLVEIRRADTIGPPGQR